MNVIASGKKLCLLALVPLLGALSLFAQEAAPTGSKKLSLDSTWKFRTDLYHQGEDEQWKLGKPSGRGGPWKDTAVEAGQPSDAYLIGGYDRRRVSLSHQGEEAVTFTVEVEPVGHGPWMRYQQVSVAPGEIYEHEFPESFQARWIRFETDTDTKATAWLVYD